MKLYSGPLSLFGAKAQIALLEKGVPHDVEMVPFAIRTRYSPKHPEVVRINPKAEVPVLVDGDLEIFDSTQIFEYLETRAPTPALWPTDPQARARARLVELTADEVVFPLVRKFFPPVTDGEVAGPALERQFAALDARLTGRTYFADEYGYADIAVFMVCAFGALVRRPPAATLSNLAEWRARVGARPAVHAVRRDMEAYLRTQGLAIDLMAAA